MINTRTTEDENFRRVLWIALLRANTHYLNFCGHVIKRKFKLRLVHSCQCRITNVKLCMLFPVLNIIRKELQANAAGVPCSLGDARHGWMALVISEDRYLEIVGFDDDGNPIEFTLPEYPGMIPNIALGAQAANIMTTNHRHQQELNIYHEYQPSTPP